MVLRAVIRVAVVDIAGGENVGVVIFLPTLEKYKLIGAVPLHLHQLLCVAWAKRACLEPHQRLLVVVASIPAEMAMVPRHPAA